METAAQAHQIINRLHEAVWELTALAVVLREDPAADPELHADARRVLLELGLMAPSPDGPRPSPGLAELVDHGPVNLASEAAAPVLQCAGLLSGSTGWTTQDEAGLVAQGRASARAATPFKQFVLPMLDGLAEMLEAESATMLDVGVGLGAMAIEYCRVFPGLRVVGLDVFPRVLELARDAVDEAEMAARIELRHQDVADLEDQRVFDLAWLPAPFVPKGALEAGLPRMVAALRPGGWLVVGHGRFHSDDEVSNAVTRLKTTAYGGTPLDDDAAQQLLRRAGLDRVWSLPTPDGAPALTVGRRPAEGN